MSFRIRSSRAIVAGVGVVALVGSTAGCPEVSKNYVDAAVIGPSHANQKGFRHVHRDTGTETVIHTFAGPPGDGEYPQARLLQVGSSLYGTTEAGGASSAGTVFELTNSGTSYSESLLYSFSGPPDGAEPTFGLFRTSGGNLFGTTPFGGLQCDHASYCGTVFELAPSGSSYSESLPYTFQGSYSGSDGEVPEGVLIQDSSGAFYGETVYGGTSSYCGIQTGWLGCGTVFKLTPSGSGYTESLIYTFEGGSDGIQPAGGLVMDSYGALYGLTNFGGNDTGTCYPTGCGTVFKLTPYGGGYTKSIIYSFEGGSAGQSPTGPLIMDSSGSLYGTTLVGGNSTSCGTGLNCGTVFKLTYSGSGYTESILYRFQGDGTDGAGIVRGVVADAAGNLYGATRSGGGTGCASGNGCGTIYKLTASTGYSESILYAFTGGSDGGGPYAVSVNTASVIGPPSLFGTACFNGADGYGVVFKITQ